MNPRPSAILNKTFPVLVSLLFQAALSAHAADMSWTNGTASYNNPLHWSPNAIPGATDKAINDNGSGNVVQINVGDPDWIVNEIRAGNSAGNGAFVQNGQNVYLTNAVGRGAVRLGVAAGRSGAYTINGGALNYSGQFNVGELGTATLDVNGGSIVGSGNLAINVGSSLDTVTATMGGTNKSDYTWFEQGFYTPDATRGIPPAGSTFTSETLPDHSFTMPANYAANNAVQVFAGVTNATITFTSPTAASALSFLGSAGFGTANLNYTVHHADSTTQAGTLAVLDWFDNAGTVAKRAGGRISADGLSVQIINDGPSFPYLLSFDIAIANTTSPVTSVDLTYASGGVAAILAVSSSTGGNFVPQAITGFNQDIIVEVGAPIYVANTVTNVLNQTAGSINITGELFIGNYGAGVYNFSGGTNEFQNWLGIGRSGGHGTLNMTGGVLNKTGNGNLLIGTGYQAPTGSTPSGIINQSGGTINSSGEFSIPENAPATGAYVLSGTGVLNVGNWMQVGRSGGSGEMSMTGGSVTKTGGGNFIVGDNATGVLNQSGGTISVNNEAWIGQGGSGKGTYNLSAAGVLNVNSWFCIAREGGNATLTMTGGSINKTGGGVFIVGDNSTGYMNQSAGTVSANEVWVGQNLSGNGTYDLSGTGSLTVNGYVVIGRDGIGTMNMSAGTLTKTGDAGSHLIIASGGTGYLNQTGGDVVSTTSETWIAENGTATWTMSGGTATLSGLRLARWTPGSGTLNLNGGTMTVNEILGGYGTAIVNFGGGKLVAGASGNLIHDLGQATVAADTIIDTAAFNVTVSQALGGAGALIKNGTGTLSLNGTNTHSGAITVNAGKLGTTTASIGANAFAIAAGTSFGVQVAADNGQLAASSVSFAGPANTFDVDLNAFGSPGAAPLAISGALTVNGTVTVNIFASSALQIGVYPLITSGTRTGGSFVIGALPLNTEATIVDNGTVVNLNVTSVNAPRWEGLAGGFWDIGVTTNWINGGTGLPTYFTEGSEVLFNDEATGTTSVNLVATVHPTTVTFNNTNLSYTLSGSGKISGSTGLSKQGTGTLAIASANDYTGPTVISAGVLSVTNLANAGSPSAIGAGNLVLAGGTLSYAGPATSVNRGYSVQANSSIDAQGDLTLSGPVTTTAGSSFTKSGVGQLAYTGAGSNNLASGTYRVQDGSLLLSGPAGGQTNSISGALSLNGAVTAAAILTNTTLNCGDLYVGNDSGMRGSVVIENGTTINDNSWFIIDNAVATMNGGTITVPGRLFLCERPGTTATLNINGGVINKNGDYFAVVNGGWNGSGARTGVVNQVAGTVGGGAEMWVGDGGGPGGNDSLGIYNMSGGTLTVNNWMGVGRDGCQGIFNLSGGTFNKGGGGDMVIGRGVDNTIGTFNMTGGTLNKSSGNPLIVGQNSGHGLFTQSGGTLNVDSEYWLGVDNNTTDATNNISGTAVFNINNWFSQGRGGRAVVNFTGGTINKAGGGNFIIGDGGTGLFTQSGGSLSINNEFWIGQAGSGNGTYNLSAGTVTVGSWVAVGRAGATGVWNMSGGSFTKTGDNGNHFIVGSGGPATLNQTGGTITSVLSDTWVAENSDGTWNLGGGDAVLSVLHIAQNSGRVGVFNLNANGRLTATEVTTGNAGSTSTLNFNGGTLVAGSGASLSFLHGLTTASVLSGGAVIDSGANVINVDQALLDGTGGGGLTKIGSGTLYLNGANTYTGPTLVNAGTLGGNGTILGPVTVASGAGLAPGASIGTLSISNSLTLSAGSTSTFEISKSAGTHDAVVGLTSVSYGGTLVLQNLGGMLQVGDSFKLFSANSYAASSFTSVISQTPGQTVTWDTTTLTTDGRVKVATAVAVPVAITPVVGAGGITLSWPTTGYTLLVQTNALNVGIRTNWVAVPGSTATNSVTLPIDHNLGSVFFRLSF